MSSAPRTGAWARVRRAVTELTPETIEQIAERVAELLGRDHRQRPVEAARLLEASELARRLGVSREWVYEHATELGAIGIGDGPRPRLRFDPEVAEAALAARRRGRDPAVPNLADTPSRRRRQQATSGVPLLPVHSPRSRGILARVFRTRGGC